jgi:hypothetical protein
MYKFSKENQIKGFVKNLGLLEDWLGFTRTKRRHTDLQRLI